MFNRKTGEFPWDMICVVYKGVDIIKPDGKNRFAGFQQLKAQRGELRMFTFKAEAGKWRLIVGKKRPAKHLLVFFARLLGQKYIARFEQTQNFSGSIRFIPVVDDIKLGIVKRQGNLPPIGVDDGSAERRKAFTGEMVIWKPFFGGTGVLHEVPQRKQKFTAYGNQIKQTVFRRQVFPHQSRIIPREMFLVPTAVQMREIPAGKAACSSVIHSYLYVYAFITCSFFGCKA